MEIDKHEPLIKKGNIKMDSDDLLNLFRLLDNYQYTIFNNLDILDEKERKEMDNCLDIYNVLRTKYILVADCRRREHLWYEILLMIDNEKYDKSAVEYKAETSLDELMKGIDFLIKTWQELSDNVGVLIGQLIKTYSHDEVRRAVLGYYLGAKTEREQIMSHLEKMQCKST